MECQVHSFPLSVNDVSFSLPFRSKAADNALSTAQLLEQALPNWPDGEIIRQLQAALRAVQVPILCNRE